MLTRLLLLLLAIALLVGIAYAVLLYITRD